MCVNGSARWTDHGGHDGRDGDPRSLRYLEWTWDPDPDDTWYVDDFAYLLREGPDEPRVVHDRHVLGLFPRATWLSLFTHVGFAPQIADLHLDRGWRRGGCRDFPGVPTPLNLAKQHLATRAVGGPR